MASVSRFFLNIIHFSSKFNFFTNTLNQNLNGEKSKNFENARNPKN